MGLVIALVLFVTAAAGINAFQNGLIHLPTPDQAAGESRPTESTSSDVAKSTKGNIAAITKGATPAPKAPSGPEPSQMAKMMLKNNGGKPLMAIQKPGTGPVNKPKPNDSSISGQWYSTEAGH
ncbi:hypothetical protein BH11ARM2_BH11ARM2_33950 [soil metagenome]